MAEERRRSLERALSADPGDEAALLRWCAERRRRGEELLPDVVRFDLWGVIFYGLSVVRAWIASGHRVEVSRRDGRVNALLVVTGQEGGDV